MSTPLSTDEWGLWVPRCFVRRFYICVLKSVIKMGHLGMRGAEGRVRYGGEDVFFMDAVLRGGLVQGVCENNSIEN